MTITKQKLYVVMDNGCFKCGVSQRVVGTFKTQKEASAAVYNRENQEANGWWDVCPPSCRIFEIEVPE
jgi:hypothetical protein